MAQLESFQSRSFKFAQQTLKFYRTVMKTDAPPHLARQMVRAGTSIGANLEEAQSAYSRRDLGWKHRVALREARECRFWLRLIAADQPQLAGEVEPLMQEAAEIVAMLTTSVKKLWAPSPLGSAP